MSSARKQIALREPLTQINPVPCNTKKIAIARDYAGRIAWRFAVWQRRATAELALNR
jgi:hypothetical protein